MMYERMLRKLEKEMFKYDIGGMSDPEHTRLGGASGRANEPQGCKRTKLQMDNRAVEEVS
jgi:hypothetical protein